MSFDQPVFTGDVTGVTAMRFLEAVRADRGLTKIYQASSSEMFGATPPRRTRPRLSIRAARTVWPTCMPSWATRNYREAYGIYAVNGILFNHESPRRGATYVTRKVTRAVARIKAGIQDKLYLGNLDATRDWGYPPKYVEGMWRMMQAPDPTDYVLATDAAYLCATSCSWLSLTSDSTRRITSNTTSGMNDLQRWTR